MTASREALCATVLMLCICFSHGLHLTREENAAVLSAALADPEPSFRVWAATHRRPYAEKVLPLLQSRELAQHGHRLSEDPTLGLILVEYASRANVWLDNARYAAKYNEENAETGHWLGLNSLADMTFEEYRQLLGTRPARHHSTDHHEDHHEDHHKRDGESEQNQDSGHHRLTTTTGLVPGFMFEDVDVSRLPRAVDWRNKSAVTTVKNQGMCGSCWAFSTTGAIEGVNAIYTHELLSLSEQELVDCDHNGIDQGCGGGMMNSAYEWIIQNRRGLHLEVDWPYLGVESPEPSCSLTPPGRTVTIDGYQEVPMGDEVALFKAAAHQPVAVAVEADSRAFQLYVGGVMADPGCGSQLNHGMLVVGYGGLDRSGHFPQPESAPKDPSLGPYWIVKNSWGPTWGNQGYINIQMGFRDNVTGLAGLCGITLASSFPIKHTPNPPAPSPQPPQPHPPSPPPAPKPPKPTPPSPGPPEPVSCDDRFSCPPESTCCCLDDSQGHQWHGLAFLRGLLGRPLVHLNNPCNSWGCCPVAGATCCEDHMHCCPPEAPVCDSDGGRCLPKQQQQKGSAASSSSSGALTSMAWLQTLPAARTSQPNNQQEESTAVQ